MGLFGCELFVKGDKVYGNECSPRPHDTGMVTFASHQVGYSQTALHVRAITGMPVPTEDRLGYRGIPSLTPAATHVVLSPYEGWDPAFGNLFNAMNMKGISFMAFNKPEAHVNRRMGIILTTAATPSILPIMA